MKSDLPYWKYTSLISRWGPVPAPIDGPILRILQRHAAAPPAEGCIFRSGRERPIVGHARQAPFWRLVLVWVLGRDLEGAGERRVAAQEPGGGQQAQGDERDAEGYRQPGGA